MDNSILNNYLTTLGYSDADIKQYLNPESNVFTYPISTLHNTLYVPYVFIQNEKDIYTNHINFWNQNRDNAFIAVGPNQSWIINAKSKPQESNFLNKSSICIKTFDYGTNSIGFEDISISEIRKEYIDSTYFFDFIFKSIRTKNEVDKDLLLNLLTLKEDLYDGSNEKTIHLLVLRCLFVKYLEDRGIFENGFLLGKLKSYNPEVLLSAFDKVQRINGDVFKYDVFTSMDIKESYIKKLALFFSSDYKSGQYHLFPYRFDKIPIQLISHVYEAFLSSDKKKEKGIYYTPSFIVDFMLSQSLREKLQTNPKARILDPAVGSGAFLVQSFKQIIDSKKNKPSFEEKIEILEEQLFGIDIDNKALQITAFSLYLALLDGEDASFIKKEIEERHPILPSLIGKTLIEANSITDNPFEEEKFDLIICNPPWGSVPVDNNDINNVKEREAIANKGIEGTVSEYKNVSDYERSQAILLKVEKWGDKNTLYSFIVKNSIFLNDNALDFRKTLLNQYELSFFYELSNYNKVLFKKKNIGKVRGKIIEIGASEPCVIIHFKKPSIKSSTNILTYISPKLTTFSETFECIQFSKSDVTKLNQSQLEEEDLLWKVLVNGNLDAYSLISKLYSLADTDLSIEARSGFQPKANMEQLGEPVWKEMIEPTDFERYYIKNKLGKFNWNQKLHRSRDSEIFQGNKIIVPVRPLKDDMLRLRGLILEQDVIYKHNIVSLKIFKSGKEISNYTPYLGLINSQLISFLVYQISTQWGKGSEKRATLRNCDLEKIPLIEIEEKYSIISKIKNIQKLYEQDGNTSQIKLLQEEIDNIVFDMYGLLEHEREIVREFYEINIDRAHHKLVTKKDILNYIHTFTASYKFLLGKNSFLNASYYISPNIGAIIHFSISDTNNTILEVADLQILNFVKRKQLTATETSKLLAEEKVKLYEEKEFYIIKSNLFKDWTKRQAIVDAKEEIELIIKNMSKR